ncbi:molybdenum cofactor biosynthesis protein C [[Clostridium] ultunense Esp]|uniref:cyclic pyranopterin monophosphate synthase MoaC n=1 Tax=Thermicanus aegyptius TaxID=94009 RepID=UPI0002B70F93|nr:cyclic pyranopterin monophosphate synthase MoaC [Thermicanus aegyptius]CCQ96094.1 molybdenum cofactor biosynthesis protein C [[Clostridium] ultunense Esp]
MERFGENELTHFNAQGHAHMVDVTEKQVTSRKAVAIGLVRMKKETLDIIRSGNVKKGDVLSVAQIAGIMAAKRTWEMIPMCHPIPLTGIDIRFQFLEEDAIRIEATVKSEGKTGVEMEALTAVQVAGLTIYDMVKAIDKEIILGPTQLLFKEGGKSGIFRRQADERGFDHDEG